MSQEESVIARLKNKSKKTGNPLQLYIQLLCQEELLRKVSLSAYKSNLILKGGLFIYALTNFEGRSTVDMDFLLRNVDNTEEKVVSIVNEILSVETGNDFIKFEVVKVEKIALERKYTGISVHLKGSIGKVKTPVYMDFGVGDVIVPESEVRTIHSQLEDLNDVEVYTYSLESTISEKYDAIIQRFELNSRMKDFYDIYYLARTFSFDGLQLAKAIRLTTSNRGTSVDSDSFERVKKLKENEIVNQRWNNFCKKQKFKIEFEEIIQVLSRFLEELTIAIANEKEFEGNWNPTDLSW